MLEYRAVLSRDGQAGGYPSSLRWPTEVSKTVSRIGVITVRYFRKPAFRARKRSIRL